MNNSNNQSGLSDPKDFWDSLHLDILTSNQKFSKKDYQSFAERSMMFSIFFRSCHPMEIVCFKKLFHLGETGFVAILDIPEILHSGTSDSAADELELYHFIKDLFPNRKYLVGPLIVNRVCLLFTQDTTVDEPTQRSESINLARELVEKLHHCFGFSASVGIGSLQSINTIYSSFLDASTSLYFRFSNRINYYKDISRNDQNMHFDYLLTEQHLLEAIRLRKTDAYDYFGLIMDFIRPFNDETKRNKILEILILSNHAMGIDSPNEAKLLNYIGYSQEFMHLEGDELIEFASRCFMLITSYVKVQSNIDYSNHIVKATKEFLEKHYTEDISLENVAEQVNISPQYFSKLIKKTTGFNFIDWLSMLRVKKAKELLTNSNLTVKEVCFMVGYKDPNYFSRIFKKRIGITPSEYIKTSSYFNNKS
jgi:two-component system response regulator YesN